MYGTSESPSDAGTERGFGVYVHWPYCRRICPYCDFNVYAAKTRDVAPLFDAIVDDLAGWRRRSGGRAVDSLFFGGGTPSLMTGEQVEQLIGEVDRLWGFAPNAEISLEANPDDKDALADFAAAGVNRLSLGVQSLDDKRLAFLGRTHSAADALAALDQARGLFPSVSLDLIYALPGQCGLQWEDELTRALRLGCDHLSLYELTIEPGAAFAYAVRRGEWTPAPDDAAAELYDLTSDLCEASGYAAYEISNHARAPRHESRHNRVYWASGDWVGVGPGAHGRLTTGGVRSAVEAAARPPEYIEQVEKTGVGWLAEERLTPLDQVRERIAMGLRVREGFARADVTELGFDIDAGALVRLSGQGLVSDDGRRIALTPKGRLFADRIAAELSP